MGDSQYKSDLRVSLVVACNDDAVLQSTLLSSPDLGGFAEVIVERNHTSASSAYNSGLDRSTADLVVFAHQDVFLPKGWLNQLYHSANYLDTHSPKWAVLGVFGVDVSGKASGHIYSTGLRKSIGSQLSRPVRIRTLDEVLIVLRRSSQLSFDNCLPAFHLYGTDICLQAHAKGFESYVFDGYCLHNSNGISILPLGYWRAWLYMRRKWFSQLPVENPCIALTRWGGYAARYLISAWIRHALGRTSPGRRVQDPSVLWERVSHATQNSISPTSRHIET